MELQIEYTIDRLNIKSVSIITQKYIIENNTKQKLGEIHRKAYNNSEEGREKIIIEVPEPYSSAILSVWGESPYYIKN